LRLYSFTISVRLSATDKQRYERLLRRYGCGLQPSKRSESFRELLKKIDLPYDSIQDNEGWSWDTEEARAELR
jgi:hypothetical protein